MKLILLTLLTGFTTMVQAQNTLYGTVTDQNNQPIKGVSVYAPELHKGTSTDDSGKYTLNSLPEANVKLTFSFMGFATQNKVVNLHQQETTFDVTMEETIFHMDEVIVSTAFNKLQSQNVMKVEHETTKSLQQKGTTTLVEGLATIPGVAQVSTGTAIGKPVIRGLSGNRVLVYSQGVRLENQQFGDEHGLGLNDSGIESVEVIKGPASLLYGSDALGGVLYFNPEKFADAHTFKANFNQSLYSNTLGSNSSLGLKTSTENWKFLACGSYDTHADYKIPNGDRVTNTRFNETDFKAGIGYSNTSVSSILRYNFNRLDLGIPDNGIAEQTTTRKTNLPRQAVFNNLLSWNTVLFFKGSKLDTEFGYVDNDRSEFEETSDPSLRMKLRTFNYDVKYHLPKFGKWETIVGLQGMAQTNRNSGENFLIPDASTDDFGVFGTAAYDWKSNSIEAGLRFDHRNISSESHGNIGEEGSFATLDRKFESFNASLGYKTHLAEPLTLRLNMASGFRAPNLAELTSNGVHEGTNRYEIGNANLQNEQNVQTDLNLEYNNSHFEFFANGFYNHIDHYIYAAPSGGMIDDNAVYRYNQNNAYLFGGEAGLHFHPHPLDWLHFESSFETVNGKKQNGDYLPLIPANNWNNTLRTEFDFKNWLTDGFATLNVSTTFDQNHVSGFETRSGGYTLVNLAFGGTLKLGKTTVDLHLNGNNLLDRTYIAHLSRLKSDGIPNIGRNIVLGMNFNI